MYECVQRVCVHGYFLREVLTSTLLSEFHYCLPTAIEHDVKRTYTHAYWSRFSFDGAWPYIFRSIHL